MGPNFRIIGAHFAEVLMRSRLLVMFLLALNAFGQNPTLSKTVQAFVRVQTPKIVLAHVRIIDGTGAPAVDDQNVSD